MKSEVRTVLKEESAAGESLLQREEKIRRRAYELYLQRKQGDGHDVEDWLEAEAEMHAKQEREAKAIAA